jgi:protein involved in polysaccharide export with SLBB domain
MKSPIIPAALALLLAATANLSRAAETTWSPARQTPQSSPKKYIDYKLRPADTLRVTVFQEAQLGTAAQPIDSDGNLRLGLLPAPLHVAGLSARETEAAIKEAYRRSGLVQNPQINVFVVSYAPRSTVAPRPASLPASKRIHLPPLLPQL